MHNERARLIEVIERAADEDNEVYLTSKAYTVHRRAELLADEILKTYGPQFGTETVAEWMAGRGYATGHGDTIKDLLVELEGQAKERKPSTT